MVTDDESHRLSELGWANECKRRKQTRFVRARKSLLHFSRQTEKSSCRSRRR